MTSIDKQDIMCSNFDGIKALIDRHAFSGSFLGQPGYTGTKRVKRVWILLEQEMMGWQWLSWTICKSFAIRSRQITTSALCQQLIIVFNSFALMFISVMHNFTSITVLLYFSWVSILLFLIFHFSRCNCFCLLTVRLPPTIVRHPVASRIYKRNVELIVLECIAVGCPAPRYCHNEYFHLSKEGHNETDWVCSWSSCGLCVCLCVMLVFSGQTTKLFKLRYGIENSYFVLEGEGSGSTRGKGKPHWRWNAGLWKFLACLLTHISKFRFAF